MQHVKEDMQPKLYELFSSEGHDGFLHDFNITLIDKIDGSDLTKRKTYCHKLLKSVVSYRLNRT